MVWFAQAAIKIFELESRAKHARDKQFGACLRMVAVFFLPLIVVPSQALVSVEFDLPSLPNHNYEYDFEDVKVIGRGWFSLGVPVAGLIAVCFTVFLVWNAAGAFLVLFTPSFKDNDQVSHIQPLIPGINVPIADTVLLIFAIALSAVLVRGLMVICCEQRFILLKYHVSTA